MTRRPLPLGLGLAGILAVALAARLAAYTGQSFSFGSDESRFIAVAQNLTNGYFPEGSTEWFGSRVGLIWPVAAVFQILPPSDASAAVWPIIGSLLSVVAAFLLGRELGGRRIALTAAALTAVAPVEVLVGARLRPDAIVPGLMALAIWCAIRAGRGRTGAALAAGLLLGLAWTVRENAVLVAPVMIVAGWRGGGRALRMGAAGLGAVIGLVAVVFAVGAGSPLRPLLGAGTDGEWRNPVAAFAWDETYLSRLWSDGFDAGTQLFLLMPLAVGSIAAVLYRRDRRAVLPGLWLAWTALYLEFGTLANLAKPIRYLTVCTIPLALLVAMAMDGRLAALVPAAVTGVLIAALWSLPGRPLRHDDSTLVARVADRLRGLPPGPVVTESFTWWSKLRTYTATGRLAVPVAVDPEFGSPDDVRTARLLTPLPEVAGLPAGYLVTGPVHLRSGWPGNWNEVREAVRRRAQTPDLRLVATVGEARIWRWGP